MTLHPDFGHGMVHDRREGFKLTLYSILSPFGRFILLYCILYIVLPAGGSAQSNLSTDTVSFVTVVPFEHGEIPYDLAAVSDSSIWYTTNKGLFHFNGKEAGLVLSPALFSKNLIEIFLVDASSDSDVWVMGHDAKTWEKTMYHFNGREWRRVAFPQYSSDQADDLVLFNFSVKHFGGTTVGWGVGQNGLLYSYDGYRWKLEKEFTDQTLRALSINSPTDVWAGGRNGVMFHYDGQRWSQVAGINLEPNEYLLASSFATSALGWAVGSGKSYRYDGSVWLADSSGEPKTGSSLVMVSHDDGWMVNQDGRIFRFNGKEWRTITRLPVQFGFNAAAFVPTGNSYKLLLTSSGGLIASVWKRVPVLVDVSAASNIHLNGGVPSTSDFNENGTEDLLVAAIATFPDRLYSNNGSGLFTETTDQLHESNDIGASQVALADIDNNGLTDILAMRISKPHLLYRNTGDWDFRREEFPIPRELITERSRILSGDLDNDGDVDLVLLPASATEINRSLVVYSNDGVGKFAQTARLLHSSASGALTVNFFLADLTGDGFIDIFKYNLGNKCELYVNRHDGTFTEEASERALDGLAIEPSPGITCAIPSDINRDGALDVVLVSHRGKAVFFLNDRHGFFTVGDSILFDTQGENPAGKFVDIDCDGDEDLFLLDRFYENHDAGSFREYTIMGFRKKGGAEFTDLDTDGDADLILQDHGDNMWLYVYRNELNPSSVALLRLNGIKSNSFGIGAKVSLWSRDSDGRRTLRSYREVNSSSPIRFVLTPPSIYDVEVCFPSGIIVTRENIQSGRIQISEFSGMSALGWDFFYSVRRSILMVNAPLEIVKLLVVMIMVAFGVRLAAVGERKKTPAINLAIGGLLVVGYLLCVHGTIRMGIVEASAIPLAGVTVATGFWVIQQRIAERRRSAHFISHYELRESLGQGGMGKVYRAVEERTKQVVALKVLSPELMHDPENRRRLASEGQLLSSFNHPNIVKVYEIGETEGRGFIAMEYLAGGTLKQHLERSFPLQLADVRRIALQVCHGLEAVHGAGIVHRDVKTGNIMLDEQGNVRIMDFGLSKSPLVTTMTTLGTVIGTLGYVAPEQVTSTTVDQRADIFSFGVMLYELLTNQLPFKGENEIAVIHSIFNTIPPAPSSIGAALPSNVDHIVVRCLSKDPAARFQSVGDLRVAIEEGFC